MNILAALILCVILGNALLHFIADLLNLRSVRADLPAAFQELYDARRYATAQKYLGARTHFGWVVSAMDLLAILVFWFAGGFERLDLWVRGTDLPTLVRGLLYITVLLSLKALIGLPSGIYATFVIEERFGFNQTTLATFVKDKIKALLLAVLLVGPLLTAVLAFLQYAGPNAWWYCWLATVGFMLVGQYVAPTWIMPLFNRFDPLPPGELREAIMAYADSIHLILDNIFIMDGSKRSTKSNAFFTGFGRRRRIVLFDTLIERHGVDELVAILAHEMGHFKQKHILKMLLLGILQAGLMFFILSFFLSYKPLFTAFYVSDVSIYAGLVLFGLLYAPLDHLAEMITLHISRRHEYAADSFAVRTTENAGALITALKKLTIDNLSNLQPHPFYVFLNYSHPPVLQRIAAIEKQLFRQT